MILIFCFKIYPYVHKDHRDKYISKLKEYIKDKDKRYQKFFQYKSFNFNKISNANYIRRTNNICESFHRTLNNIIKHSHPKIAFLVDKLKYFTCEGFKNIIKL